MIATLDASGRLTALAVSPDGSLLARRRSRGHCPCLGDPPVHPSPPGLGRHAGVSTLASLTRSGSAYTAAAAGKHRAWQLSIADTSGELPPEGIPAETVVMSPTGAWVADRDPGRGRTHPRCGHGTGVGHPRRARSQRPHRHCARRDMAGHPGGQHDLTCRTRNWTLASRFHVDAETGHINSIHASADSRHLFAVDAIAVRAWAPRAPGNCWPPSPALPEGLKIPDLLPGRLLAGSRSFHRDYLGLGRPDGRSAHSSGGGYNHAHCTALTAAPDNRLLARAYHTIETWDVQQGALADAIGFPARSRDVAIST